MTELTINISEVYAEVMEVFTSYERALVTNDVVALDGFFWDSPHAIRYGASENLYGFAAIKAFRAGRLPEGLARQLDATVVTTYGRDFATASTLFYRPNAPGKVGRQLQTWMRTPRGWKVVAAHVSLITAPEHRELV